MEPSIIEFEVGKTIFHQRVTIRREKHYTNGNHWKIHVHAINQRDEDQQVYGLTDATILAMADAIKSTQK